MLRIIILLTFFASFATSFAENIDFEKLVSERVKTCVSVKYIIEREESRIERTVTGIVADKQGLIILPEGAISFYLRPSNLKDFRIFFKDGDSDGYQADFVGINRAWNVSYIKLRNGLPKGLRPITDFPTAKLSLGQQIWGLALAPDLDYVPILYKSFVSLYAMSEKNEYFTSAPVTGTGAPAFDNAGNFVGWGQNSSIDSYILFLRNGENAPIELCDEFVSRKILPPENVKKIVESVPSSPFGDKIGWIGVSDIQVVKKDAAKFLGMEKIGAIVIGRVFDDSPAQKAGLKRGDIIVSFDGKDLPRKKSDEYTLASFIMKMLMLKPAQTHTFGILRDGKTQNIEIQTGENPRELPESQYKYFKRLGFSIREFIVDDAVNRTLQKPILDLPVVQFVKPNSPASSAHPNGLVATEIIREINSKPITSYAQAVEILTKINDDKSVKDLVILSEDYKETKLLRIKLD